ncbi:MAG: radical SAM family heme chaperone HemW [Pirellulaceae bacterium]|nr:radical SAM family heme chaperone HemW [Pirellulaceae bacterium]
MTGSRVGEGERGGAGDLHLSRSPPLPLSGSSSPRSAYLHVPFCRHRCGYCNFTLVAGRDDLIEAYLDALAIELAALDNAATSGRGPLEIDTLFFGGGTPTHLSPAQFARLLTIAGGTFRLAAGGELSIEANPADLASSTPAIRGGQGITRISLGVQSFHPPKLALLERDHAPDQIIAAFALARRLAGSVSLDLIFGTPGESLADWQRDLELAMALNPDHISTYGLTFEKGTPFWSRLARGELTQADEDLERQMYELAIDTLTAAGFEHYEVSNFARPGHRCRHNEAYWTGKPYFAAGPGAARFIGGRREINHRSTTTYIQRILAGQSPVAESEQLGPEAAARERLVFALRRMEGINVAQFAAETGFSVDFLSGKALPNLVELGLLDQSSGHLRLTRAGLLVSDSIWPKFLRR